MTLKISKLLFVLLFCRTAVLYAQQPFESIFQNTRNSPYNYWYGYNNAQVLPLDDGGYIVKDYLSPPNQDSFKLYSSARITRFNGCHNKVWSRAIDSTVNGSMNFVLRYQDPYSSIKKYPMPYPPTYGSVLNYGNNGLTYGNGTNSYYTYNGQKYYFGNYGYENNAQNKSIISTTDNNLISFDLMPGGHYDTPPVVTKLGPNGKVLWSKKLVGPAAPAGTIPVYYSQSCLASSNGGCFVVFIGFNASLFDTFPVPYISITKMDKNGKVLNAKRLSGLAYNSIYSGGIQNLLKMPDGGFVVQAGDVFLKLDSNCHLIWCRNEFGYANYSYGYDYNINSMSDSKGNLYLYEGNGNEGLYASTEGRGYIEKMDSAGNPIYLKYINDSISKIRSCFIESMGIGKDDQLAAIIGVDYFYVNPNSHSFYVKFDTAGNFGFAKLIKNNNERGYLDYSPEVSMQATADSGFLSLNNYYDTVYSATSIENSFLTKLDKNGRGSCVGKDTTFSFYNANIPYSLYIPVKTDSGFKAFDTVITITTSNFKEKMLCAPGLFPIADLGGDSIVCTAKADTLYAGNENLGARFLWSTGDTTPQITVAKSGTYWISMTNGYCTSTDTAKIIIKRLIKTGLPRDTSICSYDSALLKIRDSLAADYYWITPKKTVVNGSKIMAHDSGLYYIMLKGTVACPILDSIHLGYYPLPKGSAGPDTLLCYEQPYTMQGKGGIKYQWIPSVFLSSATDPNAEATLPNKAQYTLVISNVQGCRDSSNVLLNVRPKLHVKAAANSPICYNADALLTALATGGDSLHDQFNWPNDHATGDSVHEKLTQTGWHTVTVSDNCSAANATDSVLVNVLPAAKASFGYTPAQKTKTNQEISFNNTSANASAYLWTFDATDSSRVTSPAHIYTDTGAYQVMLVAYGLNGCPGDTAYSLIKVISDLVTIYIPNAFSPDGDGLNDYFDIKGTGIRSYQYRIYNRWGEQIFSSPVGMPGGAAWDGQFKGLPVPEGVYLYQMDVLDTQDQHHYLSGNVTVMR